MDHCLRNLKEYVCLCTLVCVKINVISYKSFVHWCILPKDHLLKITKGICIHLSSSKENVQFIGLAPNDELSNILKRENGF